MKTMQLFLLTLIVFLGACTERMVDVGDINAAKEQYDAGLDAAEVIPLGLSFRSLQAGTYLKGGTSYVVSWYIKTDPAYTEFDPGFYMSKFEVSNDAGVTWTTPTGANLIPGVSDTTISYVWTVPDSSQPGWEGSGFLGRVVVYNTKGNAHNIVSEPFVVDNHPPIITPGTLTINNVSTSPLSLRTPFTKIGFDATDALSPIYAVCFKLNSSSPPTDADACWQPLSLLGVVENKNLQIRDLGKSLGFIGGAFNFYVWAKDRAGNMSVLSNSGAGDTNVDLRVVNFTPGNAISFTHLYAANTDAPHSPPTYQELAVDGSVTTQYFVKWGYSMLAGTTLATSNPIKLEYSVNEADYTLISNTLLDGINGACSLKADEQGCFAWAVPPELANKYVRLRLTITESSGFSYSTTSNSLNTGNFRTLAGNTNANLGGSAAYALFNTYNVPSDSIMARGQLAVADDGRIFVFDNQKGVLLISPTDGLANIYIPISTTSVDGFMTGPSATAKSSAIVGVYLDYLGRVIVEETARMRRVINKVDGAGVTRPYLETFIGGGATTNRLTSGIAALTFKMGVTGGNSGSWVTPLPNGDIYFNQNSSQTPDLVDIRVYKAAANKVYPLILSGMGLLSNCVALQPASQCTFEPYRTLATDLHQSGIAGISFNPTTSYVDNLTTRFYSVLSGIYTWYSSSFNPRSGVANGTGAHTPFVWAWGSNTYITSRKGELYLSFTHSLMKYNSGATQWVRILGTGSVGQCADGTLATACQVDLHDAYINADNVVFFIDRGRIRTIASDGTVVTVSGQSRAGGDNGDPLMARFGKIPYIGRWGTDDRVIAFDYDQQVVREVSSDSVIKIAGNSSGGTSYGWTSNVSQKLATDASIYAMFWSNPVPFVVDPADGSSYFHDWVSPYGVMKLNRTGTNAGKYSRLIGGGPTSGTVRQLVQTGTGSCDGQLGNTCISSSSSYNAQKISGFAPPHDMYIGGSVQTVPSQILILNSLDTAAVSSGTQYCSYKSLFPVSDYVENFAGTNLECQYAVNYPADGLLFANQTGLPGTKMPADNSRFYYLAQEDAWLMLKYGTNRIVKVLNVRNETTLRVTSGGVISTFATLPANAMSFTVTTDNSGDTIVPYCNTSGGLAIFKPRTSSNTPIVLPFGVTCNARAIEISADGTRIIFPYMQNGISGVGDYTFR